MRSLKTTQSFFLVFLSCMSIFASCSSKKSSSSEAQTDSSCSSLSSPALKGFNLRESHSQFLTYAENKVRDLVPKAIDVNMDEESFIEGGGAQHINFNFSISGVRLCQFEARVHNLKDKAYIQGRIPNSLNLFEQVPAPMQRDDADMEHVLAALKLEAKAENIHETKCLATSDGSTLQPALELEFTVNQLPYYALISKDTIFRAEARFFDVVTAQSKIYVKDPTASAALKLKTYTLTGMSDGGSLCSARFKTVVPSTSTQAFSSDNKFFFEPTDDRFKETSLFTNISNHADYFLSLGVLSRWPGTKIDVLMDGTNNFQNNSSVYLPASTSAGTNPTIKLGTGDGKDLQNLFVDDDVVSHELGHHIVYRTLKTTSGESLVIHEGLADFFVFSKTEDPCLGRLICPSGGKICYSSTCLRIGEFPYALTDSEVPTEAHKKSQVVSSFLWDLAKGNSTNGVTAIGVSTTAKAMLKAVDLLDSDAGYANLIHSLMEADKAQNSPSNCSMIEKAAIARGFKSSMDAENVSCSNL